MIPILTVKQMRAVDSKASTEFGINSLVLMENAGRGCAEDIIRELSPPKDRYILVFCGPGNNGGDGVVAARWLTQAGYDVNIVLMEPGKASPDLKTNLATAEKLGINVSDFKDMESDLETVVEGAGLIVDAIYGTGFKGKLPEKVKSLIQTVNAGWTPVCSVDIPTGLDADNGLCDICLRANLTVTMETFKPGHFLGVAKLVRGKLTNVPIGTTDIAYRNDIDIWLAEDSDLQFDHRFPTAHKGDYGRLVIIGGMQGFTGASFLAAKAALRAGAGYVYVYHRQELAQLYASRLTEALPFSVPETADGLPDQSKLEEMWKSANTILIGPGLGRDAWAREMYRIVLDQKDKSLVLDADALNLLAENKQDLPRLNSPEVIITPHWGEFCRLANIGMAELNQDPIKALRDFQSDSRMIILLKSHLSLLRSLAAIVMINHGNDGLATGGSGDVLAGIIASLVAQGLGTGQAALFGAILLGRTAENLARKRSTASILPSDLIEELMVFASEERA